MFVISITASSPQPPAILVVSIVILSVTGFGKTAMFPALLFISSMPAVLSNFAIKIFPLLLFVNVVVPNVIVGLLKQPVI